MERTPQADPAPGAIIAAIPISLIQSIERLSLIRLKVLLKMALQLAVRLVLLNPIASLKDATYCLEVRLFYPASYLTLYVISPTNSVDESQIQVAGSDWIGTNQWQNTFHYQIITHLKHCDHS